MYLLGCCLGAFQSASSVRLRKQRQDDLREERWSPNALTQWWTLPLQRQLIIVADSFTLVQNDSLNDRLCILNRQTDNRDTLLEDTRAAKHQQCRDSVGNSRLIIPYVQTGIHRLIDSILNRIVLVPIHCIFWQGTCKTVFNIHQHLFSITAYKVHCISLYQKKGGYQEKEESRESAWLQACNQLRIQNLAQFIQFYNQRAKKETTPLAQQQRDSKHFH